MKKTCQTKTKDDLVSFAININLTDGNEPSVEAKEIIELYTEDKIDYETAEKAIINLHIKD